MNHAEVDRSALERQAELSRHRLGVTLEQLERRRHEALDLRLQARRHPLPVFTIAAGAALVVLGGTAWGLARAVRRRRAALLTNRLRLLLRPHRAERQGGPLRALAHIGGSALVGALTSVATLLARRALIRLIPPATPARQGAAAR